MALLLVFCFILYKNLEQRPYFKKKLIIFTNNKGKCEGIIKLTNNEVTEVKWMKYVTGFS